jgi:hypothetical protein
MIPPWLDNQLADGGKVVSPTHRPHFTSQEHYFSAYATRFWENVSKPQDLVRPEASGKLKERKIIHFIGSRTRDLPTFILSSSCTE